MQDECFSPALSPGKRKKPIDLEHCAPDVWDGPELGLLEMSDYVELGLVKDMLLLLPTLLDWL